MKTKQTRCILD